MSFSYKIGDVLSSILQMFFRMDAPSSSKRQELWSEPDVAMQRGFQFLAGAELVALRHIFDPAVAPLHCRAMVCLQTMSIRPAFPK